MRKLIALLACTAFVAVALGGCSTRAKLTDAERNTPPPPSAKESHFYAPPPAGDPGASPSVTPGAPTGGR